MVDTERVKYVEELEDEHDYWLSITDAARVCRIQDVSIRRAITRGDLPVRATNAGDNHRTRFVRVSDLVRAGYPILDSGAAITSDIRKVDILNLPLQQARLNELYQELTSQQESQADLLDQLQREGTATQERITQQLEELSRSQQQTSGLLATFQQEVMATQERTVGQLEELVSGQREASSHIEELTTASEAQRQQLAPLPERIDTQEHLHGELVRLVQDLQQKQKHLTEEQKRLQQVQTDLQASTQKSIETVRQELLEQQRQALKGIQAEYRAALSLARQEIGAEQQQQRGELYTRLQNQIQGVERDEARDIQRVTETQERQQEKIHILQQQLTTQKEQAASALQQHQSTTNQRIDELEKRFEDRLLAEQKARAVLEERLARYEPAQKPAATKRKAEPPA